MQARVFTHEYTHTHQHTHSHTKSLIWLTYATTRRMGKDNNNNRKKRHSRNTKRRTRRRKTRRALWHYLLNELENLTPSKPLPNCAPASSLPSSRSCCIHWKRSTKFVGKVDWQTKQLRNWTIDWLHKFNRSNSIICRTIISTIVLVSNSIIFRTIVSTIVSVKDLKFRSTYP